MLYLSFLLSKVCHSLLPVFSQNFDQSELWKKYLTSNTFVHETCHYDLKSTTEYIDTAFFISV